MSDQELKLNAEILNSVNKLQLITHNGAIQKLADRLAWMYDNGLEINYGTIHKTANELKLPSPPLNH